MALMSVNEYDAGLRLELAAYEGMGNAFYSLLQACMRTADTDNLKKLRAAFPGVYEEMAARRKSPGGLLPPDWRP